MLAAVGLWFSRFSRPVGSEPFYASLEKSLERLRVDTIQMKAKSQELRKLRNKISSAILWYSVAIFGALFAYALWVSRQPQYTFTVRGHFMRVAPVFVWPPLAWLLHHAATWLTDWKAHRDENRQLALQTRLTTIISDLKDSTHFERTQAILRKYDPSYTAAQEKERQLRSSPARRIPAITTVAVGGLLSPRLGAMVGSSIMGAGRGLMPALDYLASAVVGDNPVLTAALQEARNEAEALRQRLARAEAHTQQLQQENDNLRWRLGEDINNGGSETSGARYLEGVRAYTGEEKGLHANGLEDGTQPCGGSSEDEEVAAGLLGVHGEGSADVSSPKAVRVEKDYQTRHPAGSHEQGDSAQDSEASAAIFDSSKSQLLNRRARKNGG